MTNTNKNILNRKGNIQTFLGCNSGFDEASKIIFGAPFDSTTSYRPGARFAPSTMRSESYGIETYSPYQNKDLTNEMVYDAGDLELPFGYPEKALEMIQEVEGDILHSQKIPVMIGGEHLVTLPAIRAALQVYPDLHILHFDAHADLRDEYLGCNLSHASVMRRVWDLIGDDRIFQFGIRSGDVTEFLWADSHIQMTKFNFDGLEQTMERLQGKPIYLSIDLDVLDPGVFPGTGTPEPGGVSFDQLHRAILLACGTGEIVAVDMNELSPHYDHSGSSVAVACKLLREILLVI